MLRLYIILLLIGFSTKLYSQTSTRELIYLAEINIEQEDYVEAIKFYDTIIQRDTTELKILNSFSELLISAKIYEKAKTILEKLKINDYKNKYEPKTSFNLGSINKLLGNYDQAINHFNAALNFSTNENYKIKINRELESCLWAKNTIDSSKYECNKIHNLTNESSEFGHAVIKNKLIISSLKCNNCEDSVQTSTNGYTNKLYTINKENGAQLQEIQVLNSTINNTSNGTFSSDKKNFYFSSCKNEIHNKKCKILVSIYKNGKWNKPDTLFGEINLNDITYTMPAFGRINGTDYLFFCSDSKNGLGGLDIYFGKINKNKITQVQPITYINSIEDDIAPFFDDNESTLYFSSKWFNGFGGFDIQKTKFILNQKNDIINLGKPFNSSFNDTYIIKDSNDYFITSNRNHNSENKTCCTDIYHIKPIIKIKSDSLIYKLKNDSIKLITESFRDSEKQKNINRLNQLIPVSLFFHNDIPNPKSTDSLTKINYLETYEDYVKMLKIYEINYSNGLEGIRKTESQIEIENFFTEYVQKGKKDLDDFLKLLEIELAKGTSFELIFKGYASPLSYSIYNKLLSKRRIKSVKNYISFYNNGKLLKYIIATENNATKLTFKEEPFGENKSDTLVSDNPNDLRNSIYSKKAALERKVEIIGFKVL